MNIVFRVDASNEIGSGHVMRCLTLARKLKRNAHNIVFICRKADGSMEEFIRKNNFDVIELKKVDESIWKWMNNNWRADAHETIKNLGDISVDLLVVDHYSIDEKWEKLLNKYVGKLMIIDDLANRKHCCDILLDQNYYLNMGERYKSLIPQATVTCLGPKHSLLRDEFFRKYDRENTKSIFVFFGAADLSNETLKTINALKEIQFKYQFNVIVVTGNSNPNKEQIEKICSELSYCEYFCQVNNIAELMAKCNLAITAGGTITWERAMLDLPGIVIAVANNQIELSRALDIKKCIKYLGEHTLVDSEIIKNSVADLLENPLKMQQLNQNMQQIFNKELVIENSIVKVIEEEI